MARHYYDVWSLGSRRALQATWIGADDYGASRGDALHLTPLSEQLAEWRNDHQAMHSAIFLGEPTTFDDVLATVQQFEKDFGNQ